MVRPNGSSLGKRALDSCDMSVRVRRLLVLGGFGKLGAALQRVSPRFEVDLIPIGSRECDVRDPSRVKHLLAREDPDVIINCAAWTSVDAAETYRHQAWQVNSLGPAVVADAMNHASESCFLIHMSTDYVFSGRGAHGQPLSENCAPDPLSIYGLSKLAGEDAARALAPQRSLIVRTSWLYGGGDDDFVGRIRQIAIGGSPAHVVDDQWGSPTFVDDLAEHLCQIALLTSGGTAPSGVLHLANSGFTSRCGLAREVFDLLGMNPGAVEPVSSARIEGLAERPSWSALTSGRLADLGARPLRTWEEALAAYLDAWGR